MKHSFENAPEKIPTKDEVMEVIGGFAENVALVSELSDEQGLYLLEVKIEGKEPGATIQYEYRREGIFPNGHQSLGTVIHIVFYQDGVPYGGHDVANFNPETGEWIEV